MALDYTDFLTTFPEFSNVTETSVQLFIDIINNGFNLSGQTNTSVLNAYYFLVAHFVSTSYDLDTGLVRTLSPSYTLTSSGTDRQSASFAQMQTMSSDMSFITSTRYGQVYFTLSKQFYLFNNYFSFNNIRGCC